MSRYQQIINRLIADREKNNDRWEKLLVKDEMFIGFSRYFYDFDSELKEAYILKRSNSAVVVVRLTVNEFDNFGELINGDTQYNLIIIPKIYEDIFEDTQFISISQLTLLEDNNPFEFEDRSIKDLFVFAKENAMGIDTFFSNFNL